MEAWLQIPLLTLALHRKQVTLSVLCHRLSHYISDMNSSKPDSNQRTQKSPKISTSTLQGGNSLSRYSLCPMLCKTAAPCEARTHDLQIMRLTRCLLRQRGYIIAWSCLHRRMHCCNAITLYLHYYYTFITSVRVGLGLGCDLI